MLSNSNHDTPRSQFDAYWLLVLILALIVCAPLTYPGYFQAHSGFLPVYKLYDMEAHGISLRWVPVIGEGYDLLRGEGLLPYVLAEAVRWLGASGVAAVKIIFALGLLLGALGMYGWARRLLDRRGALLAALLYACLPYVLATVYVRGALAETLFLGILPWTLWALQRQLDGDPWATPSLALGVALLIWTQAGLALWAFAALLVYGLAIRRSRWHLTLVGLLGGLLLGAAGLWPLVAERGLGGAASVFGEHFAYAFQLLSAGWGYGVSVPGWQDSFPLQIGLVAAGLAVLAVAWLSMGPRSQRQSVKTKTLWVTVPLMIVPVLLTLTWAEPLWHLPGMAQVAQSLTYPWQLLALAAPFLALLGGYAATLLLRHAAQSEALPLWAALVALTLLASYPYLLPLTTRYEPAPAPAAILGENDVLLLDAEMEGSMQPGGEVRLTVHWQPLRPLAQDYTVFVHVVDASGTRWGQQDTQPLSGDYPTSRWQVGEIIEDHYDVKLAVGAPPDGYRLHLGLYDWQTGDRLRVGDDDKVEIGGRP